MTSISLRLAVLEGTQLEHVTLTTAGSRTSTVRLAGTSFWIDLFSLLDVWPGDMMIKTGRRC